MVEDVPSAAATRSANERLKAHWSVVFRFSVLAATLLHTVAFAVWPATEIRAVRGTANSVTRLLPQVVSAIRMPLPREPIAVPALSVAVEAALELAAPVLPMIDFGAARDVDLTAPPVASAMTQAALLGTFAPTRLQPELTNRSDVAYRLRFLYERVLTPRRTSGSTVMRIWIAADGKVERFHVFRSSGDRHLDRVAEKAVEMMRFLPAVERGLPSATVVNIPVHFHGVITGE